MPSSHRFSDPSEETNILNHVISEDLQKYGFMYLGMKAAGDSSPEFVGRIPRIVPLHPLSEEDLVKIIYEPQDSLLSQVTPGVWDGRLT
jgi:ATP-dependent Clp protease ATP-binding subunit ClpX